MNHGFVIDTRSCIGCHACSTACKSENQVPLGVSRTWVKYTEIGRFPDVRRTFQVTRCNHCANPPCVRICPVTAMYQRTDGIVEFDSDVCIGCKACMQACPYDAIYVDPDTGTAAKCHFCGHRVEQGLEPACVVVCPTHAIIAGDLDDPESEISRTIAKNNVTVRKPEQGTAPKLFYIDGNDVSLHPTALPREPKAMMFADVLSLHDEPAAEPYTDQVRHAVSLQFSGAGPTTKQAASGTAIRRPQTQGEPERGPIHVGEGRLAGQMVQVGYNAQHKIPWHWPVPAYLVTKGIASGGFLLLATAVLTGSDLPVSGAAALGFQGLIALLITTFLLVIDLERPARFLRIVFRPQLSSWLARGAFVLIAFSLLATVWVGLEVGVLTGLWGEPALFAWRTPLAIAAIPLAIGGAIYTAFLFAQCEGRDLWQSPLLPVHLLVQAAMMGAAGAALVAPIVDLGAIETWLVPVFVGALLTDLFVMLVAERIPHASELAARAAHEITGGHYRRHFWVGSILVGHLLPLGLLATGVPLLVALAAFLSIAGLFFYEYAFVMAPQELPNS